MSNTTEPAPHRVVVVGGGFGGLHAVRALRKAKMHVTLVDRANYHLFQPLLYQVATGALSPANIAAPLRSILRNQANAEVVQAEVQDFDLQNKQVLLPEDKIPFDSLIVAAGSTHSYFGHDEWAPLAPGLKSIEDATKIRSRVLSAFEKAELADDPAERNRLLTFVIVGGGPTGVELAGALSELAHHSLKHDFRRINPEHARIILVDGAPRVLSMYPESLSAEAEEFLKHLNIEVLTGQMVCEVNDSGVTYKPDNHDKSQGSAQDPPHEHIAAETVLWAAGVKASPLAGKLASAAGVETDRAGHVPVEADFTLKGHPNVFVIGDMSSAKNDDGKPLPGVAPVAIQQGEYAAKTIVHRLTGGNTKPFHYRDYGSMATVGRSKAVAMIGSWKFAGYFAWMMWLFVHLMQLVGFQNRVLVFFQWMWNYLTRGRSARLITGQTSSTPVGEPSSGAKETP